MQFQVPQFIEIESKIFGPLTLKQFIYLVGGGGIVFIFYTIFPLWLTFIFGLPVAAFSLALAFYKVNNQPFIKAVENAIHYLSEPKLYLWKKEPEIQKASEKKEDQNLPQLQVPQLTKNKLKELSWSLDIKEKIE